MKGNGIMYVAGINKYNQIYFESNNHNSVGTNIVCPPISISLQTSNCLSYSTFGSHSVTIMNNEQSTTIGPFTGNPRIQTNKKRLTKWSRITIEDEFGNEYKPTSVVCGLEYTLYLLNPRQKDDIPHLAYFYEGKNDDTLLFLDTDEHIPIALFGGSHISAAITKEGSILIIDSSIFAQDNHCPKLLTLPNSEKAIQVAFLNKFVYVLSSTGKVYRTNNLKQKQLKQVKYLEEYNITHISGSKNHILVVTNDGKVLGHGQNKHGQLGIGENVQSTNQFILIESLKDKISAAYAGSKHSLFQTSSGAIFACGSNSNGQLLLEEPSDNIYYNPTPTTINKGAVFCIAGAGISCVFVSCKLPPNMPNMKLSLPSPRAKPTKPAKESKQPKSDKIKEIFEIQSQVREMKSVFEAKNNRIIELRQENMNIIKNIENIIKKIDQNKAKVTNKKPKNTPNNTKSKILDDDDDFDDDIEPSKIEKENKNQPKVQNKKTPVVYKKPSGPLLFRKKDKTDQKDNNTENHEANETKEEENQSNVDQNKNDDKEEDEKTKEEEEEETTNNDENEIGEEHNEDDDDIDDDDDVDSNDEADEIDDDDIDINKKESKNEMTTNKNEDNENKDETNAPEEAAENENDDISDEEENNNRNEETTNAKSDEEVDAPNEKDEENLNNNDNDDKAEADESKFEQADDNENENKEDNKINDEDSDEEVDNNENDNVNESDDEQNEEALDNNENNDVDKDETEQPNKETSEKDDEEVDENPEKEGSGEYSANYSSDDDN